MRAQHWESPRPTQSGNDGDGLGRGTGYVLGTSRGVHAPRASKLRSGRWNKAWGRPLQHQTPHFNETGWSAWALKCTVLRHRLVLFLTLSITSNRPLVCKL